MHVLHINVSTKKEVIQVIKMGDYMSGLHNGVAKKDPLGGGLRRDQRCSAIYIIQSLGGDSNNEISTHIDMDRHNKRAIGWQSSGPTQR